MATAFWTVRGTQADNIDGALGHPRCLAAGSLRRQARYLRTAPDLAGKPARKRPKSPWSTVSQLNTHAIGDRGNREVLDIYEDLLGSRPDEDLRWRVEHAPDPASERSAALCRAGRDRLDAGRARDLGRPMGAAAPGVKNGQSVAPMSGGALLDADAVICNGTDVPVESISPIGLVRGVGDTAQWPMASSSSPSRPWIAWKR